MVIVGGLTRLTESGLSMVDWKPISGVLPPIGEEEWTEEFNAYKQYPEYQIKNFQMTLSEFKSIFFLEYLHRLLGRVIGLIFIIPFLIFYFRGYFNGRLLRKLLIILFLGFSQGLMGWYMVKSGLVDRPDVSHFRLAAHLFLAFLTYAYTLWVALQIKVKAPVSIVKRQRIMRLGFRALLIFGFIQIVYGAFVAGLNSGLFYNTFPKMGNLWIAEGVTAMSPLYLNFIEGIAGVQFIHRWLAIGLLILTIVLFFYGRAGSRTLWQNYSLNLILAAIGFQVVLGIVTLLNKVPISLSLLHQFGALLFLTTIIVGLYHYTPKRIYSEDQ